MAASNFQPLTRRSPLHLGRSTLLRYMGVVKLIALLCAIPARGEGSPWVEPGHERTRHHIQSLSDAGVLSTPTTAWPIMWSNIKADLDAMEPHELNAAQLWSYHYLRHELRKAMKSTHFEQTVHFSNAVTAISDFASDTFERYQASIGFGFTGDRVAFKLKGSYAHEPLDGHVYRADGSYLNYLVGNWALGIGEIDRWWGPGWESSLILGHTTRPLPSLYLQRNLATPFETPILSWLGPWQMTTFVSALESGRAIPDTKVWGARLSIKPLNRLDIGLSRMTQWGGKGRPNDIDTFVDLIFSNDDTGDASTNTGDPVETSGNQLAGIDWRWGYSVGGINGSLYGQFVGKSEGAAVPSYGIGMAGVEMNGLLGDVHSRVSLEAQNTMAHFYDKERRSGNETYEHSIYQSGYRYYGRPIGASTDNDSESVTLRSQWYFRSGHNLNLSVGRHRINIDNNGTRAPSGSVFGSEEQSNYKTQVNYTAPLNKSLLLQLSVFHYSETVSYAGIELDSGGFVSIRAHW